MHPDPIKKLIEYFMRLPGIGPRQASRFAHTILDEDKNTIDGFGNALKDIARSVGRCTDCFRSIEIHDSPAALCSICKNGNIQSLLVLEKDQDLESVEKSGHWHGAYHILGGTISLLNEKSRVTDRIRKLYERINRLDKPIEIVLATSATTEGDSTALYIERVLEPFANDKKIKLTRLGRGISSGTEMEFADPETLKNAFENRK